MLFHPPASDPKLSAGANAAVRMGALASRLVREERTRTIHPDKRAENVAEHSCMLAKVAPELARLLYPELDVNLIARLAVVHYDVEAYVGDTPTDMLAALDQAAKDQREAAGVQALLADYADLPGYCEIITQYEHQSTPEARFVRAVDKLMVLLIHIPNEGATLRRHYSYQSFLETEAELRARDAYKYGEFDQILALRQELGQALAERYLRV